jgi:polyisoprenoid-binding protein YceI
MKSLFAFVSMTLIYSSAFGAAGVVADVSLTPAGDFKAKMDDVKGEAIVKGDTVEANNVIVNLKSMKTGLPLRDKHGKEKYLEVEKYPNTIGINAKGQNGKGKAMIELRGVKKEVEGTYKIVGNEVLADFPIKLSDFKISGIKYMGVGVDDDVKVHVTLPIKK